MIATRDTVLKYTTKTGHSYNIIGQGFVQKQSLSMSSRYMNMKYKYILIISRIVLVAGAMLLVTALFLPTWRDVYTPHSTDLDYGFSWGVLMGYDIWLVSVLFSLTGWVFVLYGASAMLGVMQLYYAVRFRVQPQRVIKWAFVATSIITPIAVFFSSKPSQMLIGYFVWQASYWLTTVGLLIRRPCDQ